MNKIEEQFKNIEGAFDALNQEGGEYEVMLKMLDLPDEEFAVVYPITLRQFEKNLNNSNEVLAIIHAMNSKGVRLEDMIEDLERIGNELQKELGGKYSQQKLDFIKQMFGMIIKGLNEAEGVTRRIIPIPIEKCHKDAKIPVYVHKGDAGMDIYAVENITLAPGETKIIPTGLKVALPLGYELQVRPRSGLSVKTPLRIANAPGTIDSNYRGEIGVIITNTEPRIKDIEPKADGSIDNTCLTYGADYTITKGMRFAQLVLSEVPSVSFTEVESVLEVSDGREEGFGSSGVN